MKEKERIAGEVVIHTAGAAATTGAGSTADAAVGTLMEAGGDAPAKEFERSADKRRRRIKMKKFIVTLAMLIAVLGLCIQAYAAESTGNSSFDSFINDPRFSDGTSWQSQRPKLSPFNGWDCCAYAADFVKYCYDKSSPRDGKVFYDTSEIRAGDVLTVGNQSNGSGHWFVCLKRDGNRLYTAEGNYSGRVRIGWNYSIASSNTFSGTKHTFTAGYHFENSYSLGQKLGAGANDETIMRSLAGHTVKIYSVETGKFICSEPNSTVHADGACGAGLYQVTLTSDCWVGFKLTNGKWLSVQDYDYLKTTGEQLLSWECYRVTGYQGNFYLLSQKNNCYVQATGEAARPLQAARNAEAGLEEATWERLDFYIVD